MSFTFVLAVVASASVATAAGVDFRRDVAPVFEKHCLRCHKPGNAKGDVSLALPGDLIDGGHVVAGKPGESYLLGLLTRAKGDDRPAMPKEGKPLSREQVNLIRQWIADGAKWPAGVVLREPSRADKPWWSLEPVRPVDPPAVADAPVLKEGSDPLRNRSTTVENNSGQRVRPLFQHAPDAWRVNPIDRFVLAKLAEENLAPSPRADRGTLIRRASYDLLGLPPSAEEVERFVGGPATASPGALPDGRGSPDLSAALPDGRGSASTRVGDDDAWTRLIDRLLASPHYGERWGRHWLDVVRFGESRGFERNEIINNIWPFRDYVIRSFNDDKPFDLLVKEHLAGDVLAPGDPDTAIATAFLVAGPYDDVGNQDPKQAAQIRANTIDEMIRASSEAFLGVTVGCARCHDHKFDPILQSDYYRLYATFAGVRHGPREIATAEQREARARALGPLQKTRDELQQRIKASEQSDDARANAELQRELGRVNAKIAAVPAPPTWWAGVFSQPAETFHVFIGGDPQKKGADVAPAGLSFVDRSLAAYRLPNDAPEATRRKALAEWIVDPRNPLTARVIVNRVWHYHFGTGIVDTPSDFGYMGGRPTHPELLDWLAKKLATPEAAGGFGWRLKPLHRLIMQSETYRQSSAFREDAARTDGDSRYLWRYPPRRLSAEEIRDTMLHISGRLNVRMGGPGFRLYEYQQDNVATYVPLDVVGPETYRRAVYHQNARAARVDLMTDFDCPDPAFAAPRRAATTTPLQALTMMNHGFALDVAEFLAERIKREAGNDSAAQVERGFTLAYGRAPSEEEREASINAVRQHGLRTLCRALLNSNEFVSVR